MPLDKRFYVFRRLPKTFKVNVTQTKKSLARQLLKRVATSELPAMGPPLVPRDIGYGNPDTFSRSFRFIKRNVFLNFDGNNDIFQVPVHFKRKAMKDMCCDEGAGLILVQNPDLQYASTSETLVKLDALVNGSRPRYRKPILSLLKVGNALINVKKMNMERFDEEAHVQGLLLNWAGNAGTLLTNTVIIGHLNTGTTVLFSLFPTDLPEKYFQRYALTALVELASNIVRIQTKQYKCENVCDLIKVLQKEDIDSSEQPSSAEAESKRREKIRESWARMDEVLSGRITGSKAKMLSIALGCERPSVSKSEWKRSSRDLRYSRN